MSAEYAGHLLDRFTLEEVLDLADEYGVEREDVAALTSLSNDAPPVPGNEDYRRLPPNGEVAKLLGWPEEKATRLMRFMERLGLAYKVPRLN